MANDRTWTNNIRLMEPTQMKHLLCLYRICIERSGRLTRRSTTTKTKILDSSFKALILSHPHILFISRFHWLCLQSICRISTSSCPSHSNFLCSNRTSCIYPYVPPQQSDQSSQNVDQVVTPLPYNYPVIFPVIQNIIQTTMAQGQR